VSRDLILEQLITEVRANQRATDLVDDLAATLLGINRSDARCFDVLEERGQVSAGELAAATRLTTGAITAVIDRLERAGYARRVPDPNDRRRVLVEITAQARQATAEIMGPIAVDGEPLIARYSDSDLEIVLDFTRRGRELQEHHADRLRAMLEERKKRAG
jgi:DNA-binding MarR family transcriptional regulator